MDKEKLILSIMKEAEEDGEPLTREEAEEVAEMEIKAKGIKNYISSKPTRAKKEVKKDEVKVELITTLFGVLAKDMPQLKDLTIVNTQKEISFILDNACYSLSLIKHRPPKK